jgi:hypothetical protein
MLTRFAAAASFAGVSLFASASAAAQAAGTPPAPVARPALPAAKPAAAPRPAGAPAAKPAAAPAAPSIPQMWFIARTGSGAIAYDGYSIKPNTALGTVTLTSLLFTNAPQKGPEGKAFSYVMADDTIDCVGGQFQPSVRRLFSAEGALVNKCGFHCRATRLWRF